MVGATNPSDLKVGNSYALGVNAEENAEKIDFIEERYGDVFDLTQGELDKLDTVIAAELDRLIK
jgi:hypothetical protein